MIELNVEDLYFVCDEPTCDLARGSLGLTAQEIRARVLALQAEEDPEDEDEDEAAPAAEDDEDADPADPTTLDPLGVGAACPLCGAADPPRGGKLLAVPVRGPLTHRVAARLGSLGLRYWQSISSDSATGTNRVIDAQRNAAGDPTKSKATTSFVVGRKAMTAVVLREMPFDGHLLRYGNQDPVIWAMGDVPKARGKGTTRKRTWVPTEVKYGVDHAPPGAAARANPMYVRELQEDLFWLGYLSRRGSPIAGHFDHHTLGAVLAFKQDLVEVYGIATSSTPLSVPPGSVRAEGFTTAIWSQPGFVSPVRILLDWSNALREGKSSAASVISVVLTLLTRLAKAKQVKAFTKPLAKLTARHARLDAIAAGWPHLAALEDVTRPFLPFAPRAASKTVDALSPVPAGKPPKHANFTLLVKDPIWLDGPFEARSANRTPFIKDLTATCKLLAVSLQRIADARALLPTITAPQPHADEWKTTRAALEQALVRLEKVLGLVQYWALDCPTQIAVWLEHIVVMGTVDQATAVYLKALREGGKIGPSQRLGYQLARLTAGEDFSDAEVGARFLRDECTGRTPNHPGARCTTMPEIFALQFFGNESGLKFTHQLQEFSTRPEDIGARLVKLGIDTNAHRKGVFDAVYHKGGDWLWSRGWGVGQATDVNISLDGIELRRGLPVMPPGAEAVRHPRAYVDRFESVRDAMGRKVLPRYDSSARRDCSFGKSGGDYYDCHTCLKRFVEEKLTGADRYGRGGVFVPRSKKTAGNPDKAEGFFVDLERYTAFARGKDGVSDPTAVSEYRRFFGLEVPDADPGIVKVLQKLDAEGNIAATVAALAGDAKEAGEAAVDEAALIAGVQAHIAARTQLPCSWLHVRIRYAGTGEQAFQSLHTMLHVIGELSAKNPTVNKHVKEASDERRNA